MNEVGAEGKGESVWLGWFLHAVLSEWATLADARGEGKRAERWRGHVAALKAALEREAWDGDWYRRAYFDDGTPLGSAVNDACRIDSIAQSWSVISAAADPARQARAMAAVDEHLVRRADGLVLLLHAALRRDAAGARLHQGVRAGRPRERRPVHARGGLVGDRLRDARRRGQGRRAVRDAESDQPRQHRAPASSATRSSPTSSRRTSTPSRRTSAAAAGPGTRDRRAGCTGPGWSRFSGSGCAARGSWSTPVSRGRGPASRSCSAIAPRAMTSSSRTRRGCRGACRRSRSTAWPSVGDGTIALVDDGHTHRVRIVLG